MTARLQYNFLWINTVHYTFQGLLSIAMRVHCSSHSHSEAFRTQTFRNPRTHLLQHSRRDLGRARNHCKSCSNASNCNTETRQENAGRFNTACTSLAATLLLSQGEKCQYIVLVHFGNLTSCITLHLWSANHIQRPTRTLWAHE